MNCTFYSILFKLIIYILESLEPKTSNAKLPLNKISLLIKNLRNAAKHNNLSYQLSSIELLDETVCFKITGISLIFNSNFILISFVYRC